MQFGLGWENRSRVCTHLRGAIASGVPSPWSSQLPCSAVATKRRTERSELNPAHKEFGGEFLCRYKTADVRFPIRNSVEPCVDAHHDLCFERLPCRKGIARPQPPPALDARIAVAMQGKGSAVRPRSALSFPIHAIAHQARCNRQHVAFVGPPSINAHLHQWNMLRPVICRVSGYGNGSSFIGNFTMQVLWRVDQVENNIEEQIMKLTDYLFGIGKHAFVENE